MIAIRLQTGGQYWRQLALLWGLFGFLGLTILAVARTAPLAFVGLVMMIVPAYMLVSRYIWWVARMDDDGVTLVSGKRYAWTDLERIIDVRGVSFAFPIENAPPFRYQAHGHNHYELIFKGGHARVFDRMLKNGAEVAAALAALERGATAVRPAAEGPGSGVAS